MCTRDSKKDSVSNQSSANPDIRRPIRPINKESYHGTRYRHKFKKAAALREGDKKKAEDMKKEFHKLVGLHNMIHRLELKQERKAGI